jgi:hypothetical protein
MNAQAKYIVLQGAAEQMWVHTMDNVTDLMTFAVDELKKTVLYDHVATPAPKPKTVRTKKHVRRHLGVYGLDAESAHDVVAFMRGDYTARNINSVAEWNDLDRAVHVYLISTDMSVLSAAREYKCDKDKVSKRLKQWVRLWKRSKSK